MITINYTLIALIITTIINLALIFYLSKEKNKNQLSKIFICVLCLLHKKNYYLLLHHNHLDLVLQKLKALMGNIFYD